MNLDSAIERLYDLNVGVIGVGGERHERPHKPLLLLAVFDLIDEGKATPDRIPWCQDLRDRFTDRFLRIRKHDDKNTPENPFLYLRKDGFWQAWINDGTIRLTLGTTPLVQNVGQVFARFTDGFQFLVAIPENRHIMREALVSRYFPQLLPIKIASGHASQGCAGFQRRFRSCRIQQSSFINRQSDLCVADEQTEYGRSPAFRRKILEIYDHQCAACGLRIKLPVAQDVSFIDAAHLLPWNEFHNDHPTNGLALCKNHHWAMDRDLIAPCPDHHWQVSKILDPRRSIGERELLELARKSVLVPKDPAFHPDRNALEWRCQRLIA